MDGSLTALTGISSFLYHFDRLIISFCDEISIRNTDVIMANLLVFHTSNMLLFGSRRFEVDTLLLPIIIYTAENDITMRLVLMGTYGGLFMVLSYIRRALLDVKFLLLGLFLIICELLFFNLANSSDDLYEWFHGIHHIMAFGAQSGFICAIYKDGITGPHTPHSPIESNGARRRAEETGNCRQLVEGTGTDIENLGREGGGVPVAP
tara:strand:- start:4713 stop:5333 length:621 start_codon:yes stop_codon:yes gene_type:complete